MTTYTMPEEQAPEAPQETVAPHAPAQDNPLAALVAESRRTIQDHVRYPIKNRPGWKAEFSTLIEQDDYDRYHRAATRGKGKNQRIDMGTFSSMPLEERSTGIYRNGEQVFASDGEPLTFAHAEFIKIFGDTDSRHAVAEFIGHGHVISMASALYEAAGFGDEVEGEVVDPNDA